MTRDIQAPPGSRLRMLYLGRPVFDYHHIVPFAERSDHQTGGRDGSLSESPPRSERRGDRRPDAARVEAQPVQYSEGWVRSGSARVRAWSPAFDCLGPGRKSVCRNVCRSVPAEAVKWGRRVPVREHKTREPHRPPRFFSTKTIRAARRRGTYRQEESLASRASPCVMCGGKNQNCATRARGPVGGVQECVQEWKRKGCESRLRPSHPVRLTPQLFTYLAKLAFSAACSRVRRVASYTKGQFLVWS
jgi:hypothetical protein